MTMTMIPIAHAGHWFEGALYLAPVVILVVVLFIQGRKEDDDEVELDADGTQPARDAHA
jgi:hypothetical protein